MPSPFRAAPSFQKSCSGGADLPIAQIHGPRGRPGRVRGWGISFAFVLAWTYIYEVNREIGPYRLIGVGEDASYEPEVLIMDSNVAIDIEGFYLGNDRLTKSDRLTKEHLRDLLLVYPWHESKRRTVNLIYGWVSCENAWRRDGSFDAPKVRTLRWAVEKVIHWDEARIAREFSQSRSPSTRDKDWPKKAYLPEEDDVPVPLPDFFSCYTAVLYLCHLYRTREEGGEKRAVETFTRWIRDTLGVIGSYEQALAVSLFVGGFDDELAARKLLKLKLNASSGPDEIADGAWGAAWDISFLRAAEILHYGHLQAPQRTYLLTRDMDPWLLRQKSEIKALIDTGESQHPFVLSTWDPVKSRISQYWTTEEFHDLLHMDPELSYARLGRNAGNLLRQTFDVLADVEALMGLERSTAAAYRQRCEALGGFKG